MQMGTYARDGPKLEDCAFFETADTAELEAFERCVADARRLVSRFTPLVAAAPACKRSREGTTRRYECEPPPPAA